MSNYALMSVIIVGIGAPAFPLHPAFKLRMSCDALLLAFLRDLRNFPGPAVNHTQ
jgi:hypothetical protein